MTTCFCSTFQRTYQNVLCSCFLSRDFPFLHYFLCCSPVALYVHCHLLIQRIILFKIPAIGSITCQTSLSCSILATSVIQSGAQELTAFGKVSWLYKITAIGEFIEFLVFYFQIRIWACFLLTHMHQLWDLVLLHILPSAQNLHLDRANYTVQIHFMSLCIELHWHKTCLGTLRNPHSFAVEHAGLSLDARSDRGKEVFTCVIPSFLFYYKLYVFSGRKLLFSCSACNKFIYLMSEYLVHYTNVGENYAYESFWSARHSAFVFKLSLRNWCIFPLFPSPFWSHSLLIEHLVAEAEILESFVMLFLSVYTTRARIDNAGALQRNEK